MSTFKVKDRVIVDGEHGIVKSVHPSGYIGVKLYNGKDVCPPEDDVQLHYRRPGVDEYFLKIAKTVGERGTCDRGRMGAILVRDKRILATGYVGSPAGTAHCDEVGHEMSTVVGEDGKESRHCIRTAHAEMNAISNAARHGVSTQGATCYGKFEPCYVCAKALVNAGIVRVVCERRYHAAGPSRRLFKEAGVQLVVLSDDTETYEDQ